MDRGGRERRRTFLGRLCIFFLMILNCACLAISKGAASGRAVVLVGGWSGLDEMVAGGQQAIHSCMHKHTAFSFLLPLCCLHVQREM